MYRQPEPLFDHHRCRRTGVCVSTCPTSSLDLWNNLPFLKFAATCVSCGVCAAVCPSSAVRMSDEQDSQQATNNNTDNNFLSPE